MKIGNREIGLGRPCYIIAEMSANHNRDIETAKKIVKAAASAGADAIKLQHYTANSLTIDCDNDYFRIDGGTLWDGQTLHQLYGNIAMPYEWTSELGALANSLGLDWFSTPFDTAAVDYLESHNVPVYKIASL